jgi:hypothetical protein
MVDHEVLEPVMLHIDMPDAVIPAALHSLRFIGPKR